MSSNLETISNDLEKENPLTAEALGSSLLSKDAIELKTEIPFNDEVWNTALLKSVGDMIELDFLELRDVIEVTGPTDSDGKIQTATNEDFRINVKLKVELPDGTTKDVKMPLANYLGELYKRQIKYSEEYAISHHRAGRKEVAGMVQGKMNENKPKSQQDFLSNLGNR